MSTKNVTKTKKKSVKRKNSKKSNHVGIICGTVLGIIVLSAGGAYFGGRAYYSGKFLGNTTINNVNVSGMTYEKACDVLGAEEQPPVLKVKTVSGKTVDIDLNAVDYKVNSREEIKKALDSVNHNTWFSGFSSKSSFSYTEKVSYDKDKLKNAVKNSSWGETETADAKISMDKEKCELVKEVQGDKVTDMDKLVTYIGEQLDKGSYNIELTAETGCYKLPEVTAKSLEENFEKIQKLYKMSISIDFDYTAEKLTGKTLTDMLDIHSDGDYTVKEDKVMEYVEDVLAKKYDTYDTKRKFKSTKQGEIIVPTSSDARYGWWIDKQKTCDALVEMLEEGKSVEKAEPVYYQDGGYIYTGLKSARSKNDDIGNTYVEVDLSAQHLWYYKEGKLKYDCDIVSGQTTSEARTTLAGVYKVWYKDTNYRMKASNRDGEKWDTTCNYWTSVSPVGIGLHDTTLRWAFGGTIYQYNGSHGCINMPLEGAKYIYDNVAMGTPVVMFYRSAE